jgi:hypothetical protein
MWTDIVADPEQRAGARLKLGSSYPDRSLVDTCWQIILAIKEQVLETDYLSDCKGSHMS